jgi:hypothetical protein
VVRLELDLTATGSIIEADLPRSRVAGLPLEPGRRVYAVPTRVRVFADPGAQPSDAPFARR